MSLFCIAFVGDDEDIRVRIIASATVAVVVLVVIIIILTVLFLRSRGTDECNKKQPSDCDTLEYRNREGDYKAFFLRYKVVTVFLLVGHLNGTIVLYHPSVSC